MADIAEYRSCHLAVAANCCTHGETAGESARASVTNACAGAKEPSAFGRGRVHAGTRRGDHPDNHSRVTDRDGRAPTFRRKRPVRMESGFYLSERACVKRSSSWSWA